VFGVAVIGAGMIGAAHAQGYRLQSTFPRGVAVSLIKVVDEDPAAAASLAQRFSFAEHGTRWQDLLDDDRIDVVSVAVPNQLHFPLARALLMAGKHVLCEKPLANTAREAFELHRLASAGEPVAGIMHNYRRIPAVSDVRGMAERGELGEILHFHGHYLADYACDPLSPRSWRYERRYAGAGALADLGTHLIDLAHALCGEIDVVQSATARTVVGERRLLSLAADGDATGAVDNDDVATLAVTFASGATGDLLASRVAVGFGNGLGFTLLGRDGTVRFDYDRAMGAEVARRSDADGGFARLPARAGNAYVANLTVPVRGVGFGYAEVFSMQVHHFLTAVAHGTPLADGGFADGYRVALVVEAAEAAAASGLPKRVADVRAAVERELEGAR
jgi:predicted dehydrogenase